MHPAFSVILFTTVAGAGYGLLGLLCGLGATGYLAGSQFSSIELQYGGNGVFIPISYMGTFQSY